MSKLGTSSDIKTIPKSKGSERQGLKQLAQTKENILNNINNPSYAVSVNSQNSKHPRPSTSIQKKNVRNSSEEGVINFSNNNQSLNSKKSPNQTSLPAASQLMQYNAQILPEIAKKTPEKTFNQTMSSYQKGVGYENHINISKSNPNNNFIQTIGGNAVQTQNFIHHQSNNSNLSNAELSTGYSVDAVSSEFQSILLTEKDERFRYLVKHGTIQQVEAHGNMIFAELPQIHGVWVCYRRPIEREQNPQQLNLDSMDLVHMPLLEGQEKLKILTFQHNKIQKIQNIVSLPNLLYIDLYDNIIKEIEDTLSAVAHLRVLLLPKNQLTKIQNLESLTQLEVLDLHSNKIQQIQGINQLHHLRILNLANNLVSKIEGLENLSNLTEINLKINIIQHLENLSHLYKLEKLILSNNRIQKIDSFKELRTMTALFEVNFQGNSITRSRFEYARAIIANSLSIHTVDHKGIQNLKEELKQEEQIPSVNDGQTNSVTTLNKGSRKINSNFNFNGENQSKFNSNNGENMGILQVILIIGQQWEQELQRVMNIELNNGSKRELKNDSKVEGGHAEIEDDRILFIYGNAYEIVLSNPNFHDNIECIQLQYILFDYIMDATILGFLKKFKRLKEIILKNNHISSLLQLAKLEVVTGVQSIYIENNPVCEYSNLREFIVYRFPTILQINGKDVREADRTRAKQIFNQFDRILQLPEQFYNGENLRVFPNQIQNKQLKKDQTYLKTFNKIINQTAENFSTQVLKNIQISQALEKQVDSVLDEYANELILQMYGFK